MRSEVPGTAAARSSYRPAAKAPRRTAELLPLQSRAVRVAVDGSLPPARILRKTMSSTAGNETAQDSMDEIKAVPEQRSQGTSSPSLLGSYFEAGDEDQGEPLGTTHCPRTTTTLHSKNFAPPWASRDRHHSCRSSGATAHRCPGVKSAPPLHEQLHEIFARRRRCSSRTFHKHSHTKSCG